ncbi:MAG: LytTR family DNA-binding domain-containing protein [Gemmatimonadetes bacterium]|nr:LytTR family DNA-binding domain-containing protein [Gemmatimonadota bacterium]
MTEPAADLGHMGRTTPYIQRFAVKGDAMILFLPTSDIEWIEGARDYVRLHTQDRRYLVRGTMRSLSQNLDPAEFVRVHRSSIVRIDQISHLTPLFHGDYTVHLKNGSELRMSRRFRRQMEAILGYGF